MTDFTNIRYDQLRFDQSHISAAFVCHHRRLRTLVLQQELAAGVLLPGGGQRPNDRHQRLRREGVPVELLEQRVLGHILDLFINFIRFQIFVFNYTKNVIFLNQCV